MAAPTDGWTAMSWRQVPTCPNVAFCHLWQAIRDVVPGSHEIRIDVLVWSDEGVIVERSRWYFEKGLLSL